MFIISLGQHKL